MPVGLSQALNHRMDYLVSRQGVISGNIANAATPNYLAKDLSFVKLTKAADVDKAKGKIIESREGISLNGNSVKLDVEMLKLNETKMNYQFMTRLYAKYTAMQKMVLGRQ